MQASQAGIDLIKRFEGLRLKVYTCPAGVPTIGFGHTAGVTMDTRPITEEQAEAYLKEDLKKFERGVLSAVKVPLTQGQFDALVSFSFNLGISALQGSTLLKRLNAGQPCSDQFERWVFAGGVAMPGLRRRREAERRMFESGT